MDWITADNAKRILIVAGLLVSLSGTFGFQLSNLGKEKAIERVIIIKDDQRDKQIAGIALEYKRMCQ